MASENSPSGADLSPAGALDAADAPETVNVSHEVRVGNDAGSASQASQHFYQDDRVSERVKRWAESPNAFFRHVAPGCVACQLYKAIQALLNAGHRKVLPARGSKRPQEETLIGILELRIYLVQFYLLRSGFHEIFHGGGHADSLAAFLTAHGLGEHASLSAGFAVNARRGSRYHKLVTETGHTGVLLLSTTFGTTALENKKLLNSISTTAIKDIENLQDMQLYNDATRRIFSVFENHRENWLNSMQQWALSGVRAPVQPLVDTLQEQQSSQLTPSCSDPSRGLPMVSIPSFAAQEPLNPSHTSTITNPEASTTPGLCSDITQTAIVAEDIHGAKWHFDTSAIVSLLDTSGIIRQVRVGALAEGRSHPDVMTPRDASTVATYINMEYTDGA